MADEQPLLTTPDGARRIVQAVQQTLDGEVQTSPLYTGSPDPRPDPRRQPQFFPAKITAFTASGDNRWKYTIQRVYKSAAGYGVWIPYGDALTYAYNFTEDMNSASGIQGNGVDVANLPDGFTMQPVPVDAIVLATIIYADANTAEYWFSYTTVPDGTCDEDAARTADVADDSELLAMIGF